MDLEDLPSVPRSDAEYLECFVAFSKAVTEKNEKLINIIISKEGILNRQFFEQEDTLLHIVAQRGTVATAAKLCKLGVNVNLKNEYGQSPIFHAIKHSTEMVNLLLNNGVILKKRCNEYARPLQEALLCGTKEIVQIIVNKIFAHKYETRLKSIRVENSDETMEALLNYRTDLFLHVDDYPLLIFFAAKNGNLDLFRKTLDGCRKYLSSAKDLIRNLPPRELDFGGSDNRTALHYAVAQQEPEVVRFLLNEGADVNCRTINNYSPLHFAAYFENGEICKTLLSFEAQMNIRGEKDRGEYSGLSPLHLVCGGNTSLSLFISNRNSFYEEIDGLVRPGIAIEPDFEPEPLFSLGIMKLLLEKGADPDLSDIDDGTTPLLGACKAGRLEAVKLLLEFGANIWTCDYYGSTALHYATCGESFDMVDFLLERGFDINIENGNGDTPLFFCLCDRDENCVEMIEYLADLGANINARCSESTSCLGMASHCDFSDNIECLLELGAKFEMEFISKDYIFGLDPCRKTILAFFVLKDDHILQDFIKNYIPNERSGISQLCQFCATCKLEIKQLKCTQILKNRRFSFYDFLSRDIYSALQIIKNVKMRKVFASEEYKNQFPCYEYLLKKRFERLELLEKTIDNVVEFLRGYKKINIPILVVDMILSFFGSSDFRNFGRALTRKRA